MSEIREQLAEALILRGFRPSGELADLVVPLMERHAAEAERRGYERGRRDFQFQPSGDNHHNAALCPYCSPAARPAAAHTHGPDNGRRDTTSEEKR